MCAHTNMHPDELVCTHTHTHTDTYEAHINIHTGNVNMGKGSEFHLRLIICPKAKILADTERWMGRGREMSSLL